MQIRQCSLELVVEANTCVAMMVLKPLTTAAINCKADQCSRSSDRTDGLIGKKFCDLLCFKLVLLLFDELSTLTQEID